MDPVIPVPIHAVAQQGMGRRAEERKCRWSAPEARNELIVFEQFFTQFCQVRFADFARRDAVSDGQCGGRPHSLTGDGAGPHDPD